MPVAWTDGAGRQASGVFTAVEAADCDPARSVRAPEALQLRRVAGPL